jgi:hypothetical protein
MIKYSGDIEILNNLEISGFFVGWPNPPSNEVFKKLLSGSYKIF